MCTVSLQLYGRIGLREAVQSWDAALHFALTDLARRKDYGIAEQEISIGWKLVSIYVSKLVRVEEIEYNRLVLTCASQFTCTILTCTSQIMLDKYRLIYSKYIFTLCLN